METPCWCPSEGHQHGGRRATKTSVIEYYSRALTDLKLILFLVSITVNLAKTYLDKSSIDLHERPPRPLFNVTQHINLEFKHALLQNERPCHVGRKRVKRKLLRGSYT